MAPMKREIIINQIIDLSNGRCPVHHKTMSPDDKFKFLNKEYKIVVCDNEGCYLKGLQDFTGSVFLLP